MPANNLPGETGETFTNPVNVTEADIWAEIAEYWKQPDQQLPGDIPVFRIAEHRHKKTATMVEIIKADPHPDYELKQVKGGNGRMIWVLRKK